MNLREHRREVILTVVLLALLVYLFLPSLSTPEEAVSEDEDVPAARSVHTVLDGPDVDLTLLTQQPQDLDGDGRNLFDYGKIKPPGPTPEELEAKRLADEAKRRMEEERRKKAEEEAERLRQEAAARAAALAAERKANPPTPPKPPKPVPPDFPYKFIGVVGPSEAKIAIFLDNNDFLMAQEGETVKEQFRIVKIGYDTLQLGYTDPVFEEDSSILQMGKDKK